MPPVTLRTLLARLPGVRVLAGEQSLNREVRWAHVSELADPTPFLRGGELVLSAGVHLPQDGAGFRGYVARVAAFGVAGLGFGIAPLHASVPAGLVSACAGHGLPLLEIPPSVPFIAITEALASEIEARRLDGLRHLGHAQRAIVGAAGLRQPVSAVLRRLAEQLGAGVLLTEPASGLRWKAGPPVAAGTGTDVARAVEQIVAGPAQAGAALQEDGQHVVVQAVGGGERRAALLIVRPTPLSTTERGIAGVATSVLTLLRRGIPRQAGLLLGAALAAAACGAPVSAWEEPVARAFGVHPGSRWQAVACSPQRKPGSRAAGRSWQERVHSICASPLAASGGNETVVIVPEAARAAQLAGPLARAGAVTGVSAPRPWGQIAEAVTDARAALATAQVTGRPAVPGAPAEADLGGAVDPARAQQFAAALLGPVFRARPRSAHTLLATLRCWLEHHGRWDTTAAALGIHRNTVRNRISAVSQALGHDLSDPGTRMQLWFALRWHSAGT